MADTAAERFARIEEQLLNVREDLKDIKADLHHRRTPWWQWTGLVLAVLALALGPVGAVYNAVLTLQLENRDQGMQLQLMQRDVDKLMGRENAAPERH